MNQLVSPDFSVAGRLGYCLEYASRLVFHNPAPGSTAWQAWLQTRYRVPIPTDGYIPHWFSGAGGAGHVVIGNSLAGYHSSPYSLSSSAQYQQGTTTHALLPTISEVERIYGVKYVGSSLDILGLKVAEENQMQPLTPDQVNHAYLMVNQPSTSKDWTYYATKPGELIDNLWSAYGEAQYELAKNPPPLPSGTLPAGTYIQVDPKDIHTI